MNIDKFLERFEAKYIPEPNSGCWLWTAHCNNKGYGFLNLGRGKKILAHRFSYEAYVGPIPEGLVIDHLCRVSYCVNPRHLEPVTHGVNMARGIILERRRAQAAAITHCRHGHPFSGDNLIVRNGYKSCRECRRRIEHASNQRRKSIG